MWLKKTVIFLSSIASNKMKKYDKFIRNSTHKSKKSTKVFFMKHQTNEFKELLEDKTSNIIYVRT